MPRTFSDHVSHLRSKPHHVREAIAFGASATITGVVAFTWMIAVINSDAFKLDTVPASLAEQSTSAQETFAEGKSSFTNLLGAAGASLGASSSPSSLTIVDAGSTSTIVAPKTANNTSDTVIHF